MLSQTAEYALRAALYLARSSDGRPATAETIAGALAAPPNYMAKTLHALAKAGIVEGMRGPHGGFRLVPSPSELSVARIVETFDEPVRRGPCLLGGRECDAANPCGAHFRWLGLRRAMHAPLASTTLADLLADVAMELPEAG
ncbi:MAG TPA: Rrf2 family transcriptional regulator [Longimicrobiales bacterium]|nr:Rrf2 family transcriptional regulator [Longimicrobiales bacterium]